MAVSYSRKDRDYFLVAFQRVDVDGAAAAAEARQARGTNEILDAGIGKDIGQLLLRHPQRLDLEEPVEQAGDVGIFGGDVGARRGLQLALLALQTPPK